MKIILLGACRALVEGEANGRTVAPPVTAIFCQDPRRSPGFVERKQKFPTGRNGCSVVSDRQSGK
ncbi:hypothetical protein AB0F15_05405 [Amycolatopsis sp. NPDC026612]|uniref:hypothetical protein n=1 Tax=Amycolatopsis sp. NPDC026612 TaxID=3155466 RepID=UPI0033F8E7CE